MWKRKGGKRLQNGAHEKPKRKKITTTKALVWTIVANAIAWIWCSYILAALDKIQIAESLSSEAVRTIIGVVFAYCLKSGIENLSKNNSWPDKSQKNGDDDQPVG